MFLLQKYNDEKAINVDYQILKELLENSRIGYDELLLKDFFSDNNLKDKSEFPEEYKNAIPLGTIDFVTAYLNIFKNIEKMNPIEIPLCLRKDEFLKRKYSIVKGSNVPSSGRFFIKNVSSLKGFCYLGYIQDICNEPDFLTGKKPIEDDELYQVSEIVDVWSEYRIYIISGKIYAIAYYDGDVCLFPDVDLIKKANLIYSAQKDYPVSYTMDVMINERGTSIIEIHPLFSCGIYQTILGTDFLYGYKDSMKYIEKYNTKISLFSNFG